MSGIDLSQFNHCHSTDPPSKRVLITHGEFKGAYGLLMGRWEGRDFRKWTIQLSGWSGPEMWVSLLPGHFKTFQPAKGGAK